MRELAYILRKPLLILALSIATLAAAIASCHGQDASHVVRIRVAEGGGAFSCGSGTLIGKTEAGHGVILTCWHLYRDSQGPTYVDFPTGERREARLVKTTAAADLALLLVADPPSEGTPLSDSTMPRGSAATIAGYGGQGVYLAQRGQVKTISSFDGGQSWEARVVTVQARSGDSGGPIYDEAGNVCGVISCASPGETVGTCGPQVWQFVQSCGPYGCPRPMFRPRPTAPIPRLIAPKRPKPIDGNSAAAPVPDVNPTRPVGPMQRSDDIQELKNALVSLEAKIDAAKCKCEKEAAKPAEAKPESGACNCDVERLVAIIEAHDKRITNLTVKVDGLKSLDARLSALEKAKPPTVEQIAAQLPPIEFKILNKDGTVEESRNVHLGGNLGIQKTFINKRPK